jgi:hypothetical protein
MSSETQKKLDQPNTTLINLRQDYKNISRYIHPDKFVGELSNIATVVMKNFNAIQEIAKNTNDVSNLKVIEEIYRQITNKLEQKQTSIDATDLNDIDHLIQSYRPSTESSKAYRKIEYPIPKETNLIFVTDEFCVISRRGKCIIFDTSDGTYSKINDDGTCEFLRNGKSVMPSTISKELAEEKGIIVDQNGNVTMSEKFVHNISYTLEVIKGFLTKNVIITGGDHYITLENGNKDYDTQYSLTNNTTVHFSGVGNCRITNIDNSSVNVQGKIRLVIELMQSGSLTNHAENTTINNINGGKIKMYGKNTFVNNFNGGEVEVMTHATLQVGTKNGGRFTNKGYSPNVQVQRDLTK